MIRHTTPRQKAGWVLFILYLCLLAYFMFFSESFGRTETDREYAYNLVHFLKKSAVISVIMRFSGLGIFMINIVGNTQPLSLLVSFCPLSAKEAACGIIQ